MKETTTEITLDPDPKEPDKFYLCTVRGNVVRNVENARRALLSLRDEPEIEPRRDFYKQPNLKPHKNKKPTDPNKIIPFNNLTLSGHDGRNQRMNSRKSSTPPKMLGMVRASEPVQESPKCVMASPAPNLKKPKIKCVKKLKIIVPQLVKTSNSRARPNKSVRIKNVPTEYSLRKVVYSDWLSRKWKYRMKKHLELDMRLTVPSQLMVAVRVNNQLNPVRAFYSGSTTIEDDASNRYMTCDYCFREFSTQHSFLSHWRKEAPNCSHLSISYKENMKRSIQPILDKMPICYYFYSCYRCNLHFPDLRSYKVHVELGRGCPFLCTDCGGRFDKFEYFLIHRGMVHRYEELKVKKYYTCDGCLRKCLSFSKLQSHQENDCLEGMIINQGMDLFTRGLKVTSTPTFSVTLTTREIQIGPPLFLPSSSRSSHGGGILNSHRTKKMK